MKPHPFRVRRMSRKIVPMDAIGDDIAIGYCGVGRVTVASVSWIDKNGKL